MSHYQMSWNQAFSHVHQMLQSIKHELKQATNKTHREHLLTEAKIWQQVRSKLILCEW